MSNSRIKSPTVENDPDRLAEVFQALGNPHRLRILLRLAACCPPSQPGCVSTEGTGACVGELGRDLGIAASTVSHHIKELRRAGLLRQERRGQKIECRVDGEMLRGLAGFLRETEKGDGNDGACNP